MDPEPDVSKSDSTSLSPFYEYEGTVLQDPEEECLLKHANFSAPSEQFCKAVWDTIYCWPPSPVGETVARPCKVFLHWVGLDTALDESQGYAYRSCDVDGQWLGNWTNYTECIALLPEKVGPTLPITVSYIVFVGSLISLVTLAATLFIFCYFKSLQCSRIRVHRNLVISLIIHSVLMVVIPLPVIFHETVALLDDAGWACKTILTVKMYAAMACINWMFVEGLLLHSSITVSVFQQEPPFKVYYAIGWGIPFICVTSWVILMIFMLPTPCWSGYGRLPYIWVITGPMILALSINTIFLINIIRILITKLRTSLSIETKQVRKAIKATALLFPLLGITHLLFCINPRDDAHLEQAYMITNALLQSSQGLFVALLYCFLNSEVQSVLWTAYMRSSLRRHPERSYVHRPNGMASTTMTSYVSQANGNNEKVAGRSNSIPLGSLPEDQEDVTSPLTPSAKSTEVIDHETSFIT